MNTKKVITITAVTILALAALGGGIAFAQSNQPGRGGMMGGYGNGGSFSPGGMMGGYGNDGGYGRGGMMGGFAGNGDPNWTDNMHEWMSANGGMHTFVWNGVAEALDLTPDELNAELASGKTLAEIADAQGVSREQLAAALETSVKAGLDKAVTDGTLTQAQADAMLTRMGGNFEWMLDHAGSGSCHGNFAPQSES